MTYLISFSENDLDLIRMALDLAARHTAWLPGQSETFERMNAELGDLKARQDATS